MVRFPPSLWRPTLVILVRFPQLVAGGLRSLHCRTAACHELITPGRRTSDNSSTSDVVALAALAALALLFADQGPVLHVLWMFRIPGWKRSSKALRDPDAWSCLTEFTLKIHVEDSWSETWRLDRLGKLFGGVRSLLLGTNCCYCR